LAIWAILLISFGVGLVGGLCNGLLKEEGLIFPRREPMPGGGGILRPGFAGNMIIGGIAAIVVVGSSGPLSQLGMAATYEPTVGFIIGALISGFGGARILTGEVDKRLLNASKESEGDNIRVLSERISRLEEELERQRGGS